MTTKSIESICHTLAAHSESREAVVAGRSFVPLLPLLEHPFAQVQSAIPVALAAVGFSHKEIENTSTERIAIFALTKANLGTYWGELAISWLEQGLQMNENFAVALETIAQNDRFCQADRHRAFALTKRWQRSLTGPKH
jgi:hypothetical protein